MRNAALVAGGLIVATAAVAVPPLLADNTDSNNVSVAGTIVAPLAISITRPMTMPHIVRPQASNSEPIARVRLTCDPVSDAGNTVAYTTGNGNPFAHGVAAASSPSASSANKGAFSAGATGTCAQMVISGQSNYFFKTTISATTGGATGVSLGSVSCVDGSNNSANTGDQLQLSGASLTIRCGATVSVDNTSTATSYSGSFSYTVTYD